mmetsp:Transcript_7972/g.18476  ORF Transcript_7972/g.18476 Transcript_7972/m.18476 type:complete len:349 (+) Transcript_7972:123-1169(+)
MLRQLLFGAGALLSWHLLRFPFGQITAIGIIGYVMNLRYVGFLPGARIPLSLPPPPKDAAAEADNGKMTVTMLSHNVWCHYLQQWYAPSSSKRLSGLLSAIDKGDYDVVCVQELFLFRLGPFCISDNYEQFSRGMSRLGYIHQTDPRPSLPLLGQNNGLCIFSKLPFTSPPVSQDFATSGELVCTKGFSRATIEFRGAPLHIVTTHMDSKKKPKNVKEIQAGEIASALQPLLASTSSKRQVRCVVAGDFNICSRGTKDDGTQYRVLKAALAPMTDVYDGPEIASTRRPDTKPWARGKKKGKEGGAAIDHVFVSQGLECDSPNVTDIRCSDGTVVSDHLGLEVELLARE